MVSGLTGSGNSRPSLERAHDGRAAGRLRRVDPRQLAVDEADLAQLAEAATDARQQRAAGDRRHEVLREAPAQLLGDFEPERLRALGVVAAQVDVREAPAELVGNLRAQPIHVVVVAAHADDVRPEDRGAEHLAELEVVGDEDVAVEPEPRRVRRDAVGEVAGRRAAEHGEPELHGARRRHRDDAILVRQRRMVDRIVLDVQLLQAEPLGEPVGADERRVPGVKPGARLAGDRQQLAKAPHVPRARFR